MAPTIREVTEPALLTSLYFRSLRVVNSSVNFFTARAERYFCSKSFVFNFLLIDFDKGKNNVAKLTQQKNKKSDSLRKQDTSILYTTNLLRNRMRDTVTSHITNRDKKYLISIFEIIKNIFCFFLKLIYFCYDKQY